MKVAVVGAGYVGVVTGACLAEAGHEVTLVDLDAERVRSLAEGRAPLYEPGLDELVARHAGRGLRASQDLAPAVGNADVTLLCVGTPTSDGDIDLRFVDAAAESVGQALRNHTEPHVLAVKSTVVPGTTADRVRPIVERAAERGPAEHLHVAMNPEFLREGSAVEDFAMPDRIILGVDAPEAEDLLRRLYQPFERAEVRVVSTRTAEMTKYASNAVLATLISFSNEIAGMCDRLPGVDVREVLAGVRADRRWSPIEEDGTRVRPGILSYVEAGCGFGGSCFPKDVAALHGFGRAIGREPRILDAVQRVNERQPLEVVGLLERGLGSLRGRTVAVLGLAFKPHTDDVRESPALTVVRELAARGCEVRVFDPEALETARPHLKDDVVYAPDVPSAIRDADAVALLTAWPQFSELPAQLRELRSGSDPLPLLVDGRRMLAPESYARYAGVGLGPVDPDAASGAD